MLRIFFCSRYFKNCLRLSRTYSLAPSPAYASGWKSETCLTLMYLLSSLIKIAFALVAALLLAPELLHCWRSFEGVSLDNVRFDG